MRIGHNLLGRKIKRKEKRSKTKGVVLKIDEHAGAILIKYEEGGQGWWPEDCLDYDNE